MRNLDESLAIWIAIIGGSAGIVTAIGGILKVFQDALLNRSVAGKNSADSEVALLSVADVHLYRPALTELAKVRASQATMEVQVRDMRDMMRVHSAWDDQILSILRGHGLLDENVPAPPPLG